MWVLCSLQLPSNNACAWSKIDRYHPLRLLDSDLRQSCHVEKLATSPPQKRMRKKGSRWGKEEPLGDQSPSVPTPQRPPSKQ